MKPPVWTQAADQTVLINATAHNDRTGKQRIGPFESGTVLKKGLELRFIAVARNGVPYSGKDVEVQWQVVNTDRDALLEDSLRGGFYRSATRGVRWETTKYRGLHWVQAFVIRRRDRKQIGKSERFFVVIE
jgi:hypothetical protein